MRSSISASAFLSIFGFLSMSAIAHSIVSEVASVPTANMDYKLKQNQRNIRNKIRNPNKTSKVIVAHILLEIL